jgi:hypothetical protein
MYKYNSTVSKLGHFNKKVKITPILRCTFIDNNHAYMCQHLEKRTDDAALKIHKHASISVTTSNEIHKKLYPHRELKLVSDI